MHLFSVLSPLTRHRKMRFYGSPLSILLLMLCFLPFDNPVFLKNTTVILCLFYHKAFKIQTTFPISLWSIFKKFSLKWLLLVCIQEKKMFKVLQEKWICYLTKFRQNPKHIITILFSHIFLVMLNFIISYTVSNLGRGYVVR